MNTQQVHLNSSISPLCNSSIMTTTCDLNQTVDETSSCLSWDFSFSERTFLVLFLVFLACALCSSIANGLLSFLMVRYKKLLWQPQYILINNIALCGFGMSFVTALVVFFSVIRKQSQIYGCWCIAQFSILRFFFLTIQMTLAFTAVERYIFICHGIHYLRMINTCNVRFSMVLIWLVSGAVSLHGGLLLSQMKHGFQEKTSGLLCDVFTIKEHIAFSQKDGMLVFVPPSVITTLCILAICYCYVRMYHTALRVSMALKCNNHRANRTVGLYFFMFLLQLAPNMAFVILTVMGKRKASPCRTITSIVTPLLIMIPSCINAAFLLVRNPEIKHLLFSGYHQKRQSTVIAEVELFQQSGRIDGVVEHAHQVEMDNQPSTPSHLPGFVFLDASDDC